MAAQKELVPLNPIPGSAGERNQEDDDRQGATYCCSDRYHRRLAIGSIICGCSCIGIKALINSVKAENIDDPERAAEFSRRAKKFGIMSIVAWFCFLISIPVLLALFSYLLTIRE